MSDVRSQVLEGFVAVTAEVRARFGSLTREQLEWRPPSGGWSVAQCLDHLIITTTSYLPDLRAIGAGTRPVRTWERLSPFSRAFGRMLVSLMRQDDKRSKTPPRFVPPSDVGGDIVARFAESQDELAAAIRTTMHVDWDRTIVTSTFNRIATYPLADAYTIILEHQRRHLRQAQRVIEESGFPKRVA